MVKETDPKKNYQKLKRKNLQRRKRLNKLSSKSNLLILIVSNFCKRLLSEQKMRGLKQWKPKKFVKKLRLTLLKRLKKLKRLNANKN